MLKIDLHIHTDNSDGLLSVKELIKLASERKMDHIAITDHDSIAGLAEAEALTEKYGINLIPAVEVSSFYKGLDVHILAYYIDPDNDRLLNMLKTIQSGRFVRAQRIVKLLKHQGVNLSLDEIIQLTGENSLIGRPHIAQAIVNAGYTKTKQESFDRYIKEGRPAFVTKPVPSTKKVVKTIKKAGGIPVLAHPYTIGKDDLIFDLIGFGIKGMEVYYAKCNEEIVSYYERIACDFDLIRTGGTDFHGSAFDLELFGNYQVPEFVIEEVENRINTKLLASVI